ncbi:hypothetical protein BD311DRAFT_777905 [Dichomitus squalens]|uniref:Uncharacterized protein n=1 Tax=Dichomitus squalens TaxID=114155 RepID=A0A4Q9MRZ0_9APHY|nr:hypothetical protein BD311DRAFT_777905 [Dichomitus squalens]
MYLRRRLEVLFPPLLAAQRSSWEQGICTQALLECHMLGESIGNSVHAQFGAPFGFVPWLYALAHDALVRQGPDGRLAVLLNGDGKSDAGVLDPACIGSTLYYLWSVQQKHRLPVANVNTREFAFPTPRGVERMLRYILEECPRASVTRGAASRDEQLLSHRIDVVEIWSDSVYMLSPFLAPSGEWSHIFDLTSYQFKRKAFWGVGNGWVCCGIIRVLLTVFHADFGLTSEAEDEQTAPLLRKVYHILLRTIRGCLVYILPSHLFRDVLDDPASFEETNLSQMLSYTLYRLLDLHQAYPAFKAVRLSPLTDREREDWEELAQAMQRATEAKTDLWGFVRDVCGSPRFNSPGTAAEGQAWAMMMEVARAEYLWHKSQQIPTPGTWN